jgi:hypothetical protein
MLIFHAITLLSPLAPPLALLLISPCRAERHFATIDILPIDYYATP